MELLPFRLLFQLFCIQSCPKRNLKTSNQQCPSSTNCLFLMVLEAVTGSERTPAKPRFLTDLFSKVTSLHRTRHRDVHPVMQHLPFLPPLLWRQIGMGQINNDNYAHQMLRRRVSESPDMLKDEHVSWSTSWRNTIRTTSTRRISTAQKGKYWT